VSIVRTDPYAIHNFGFIGVFMVVSGRSDKIWLATIETFQLGTSRTVGGTRTPPNALSACPGEGQ
jgi:hypothetical protein